MRDLQHIPKAKKREIKKGKCGTLFLIYELETFPANKSYLRAYIRKLQWFFVTADQ